MENFIGGAGDGCESSATPGHGRVTGELHSRIARSMTIALIGAAALFGAQTKIWTQGEFADFEKGVIKNLSVRSDGLLTLAPVSRELFDTSTAYLWAMAQDSKGNLYAGGGTTAKLYRVPPDGKGKMLADLGAVEIHAIVVDSKDRVYEATSPDGKVYRISGNGKPEVFYDPKAKYIWAMAFDSKGDLFVATGDQGEIHRVTPDGKGKVFFKSDETHVRSMAIDPNDNLIVGTDPGGLVLRVSPAGEGFVLYQMAKREVTAVAVARDGSIYAAGVGTKQAAGSAPASIPVTPPPAPVTVTVNAPGAPGPAAARPPAPPPVSLGASAVSGGSDVYQIEPNGNPRRVWTHSQDVVYALAFDSAGHVLLGAGNRGNIYRIESPSLYTALLTMPATQITAFQAGQNGRLYAATANVGKIYEIGPGMEKQGTIESDVFDASMYTLWGRLSFEANLNGGTVGIETRTGNLDQPQKNWSAWSSPITSPKGGRIASPPARFVQWRATLTADAAGRSPELESVDVAYLPKNVEPRIDEIEITPANYKFPAPTTTVPGAPSQSLNLPPLGRRPTPSPSFTTETTTTPAMQLAKGFIGARWLASDPNGDPLLYTLEIRGVNETQWKPLKEKVAEKYLAWDSTAFPDGEYRLRVTASDAPGNPPGEALTTHMESAPFTIDNTPPKITNLTATRNSGKLQVRWHAADALNNVTKAEYSLDGGDWTVVAPVSRLSDSPELDYDLTVDATPGEHTIAVRVQDDYDNQSAEKVVVK
jgi:sugar lactone lactonase YvrE